MNVINAKSPPASRPFDAWAVLDFWLRRWPWVACWTLALAVAGGFLAHAFWGRSYTSLAQLIHYQPSAVEDTFHPRDLSAPSLVVMLQSAGLMEEIGAQLSPPLDGKTLARRLTVTLDRNNDVVTISGTGPDRAATIDLVNRYCNAAIAYTQKLQRQEATAAGNQVVGELKVIESDIAAARATIPAESAGTVAGLAATSAADAGPPSDLPQRIQAARDQLDDLLGRYTDAHPLVREQRARLAALEDAARRSGATGRAQARAAAPPPTFYGRVTPEEVAMGERLRNLEVSRALLLARSRAIEPFRDRPPGYFRILMPASAAPSLEHKHRLEIVLCVCLGAFFGLMGSAGQILLGEFLDNRVKTRADVARVTGLPLLATLGDLNRLSAAGRDQWAFRAWTALQSRLSLSPNHGMVCGITSAHPGDGRTTWIRLLAQAAGNCGFRVLTITAQPSPEMAAELARTEKHVRPRVEELPSAESVALTTSVLAMPSQIVDRLAAVDSPPRVDIPLPSWVWNLERRKQWQSALEAWRAIENVVIFVELPPASIPETVLLAENIPNLLWLVDSNHSDAAETHHELETLRDARCNLVGAVLNRERATPIRGRFSRWLGSSAFLAALLLAGASGRSVAAEPEAAAAAPAAFSVTDPAQRTGWERRLTLGPGDVLSFHLYGAPELNQEEVPIGPDGRVSYLEAENVLASGLTVDELRERLNTALGQYRRAPQAYVIPVAYRSKKYYVLGTVVQKGAFPLDRPITVLEAVARARGFETGLSGGALMETTDFGHSFLARGGRRVPVDFEKLFRRGDLTQNVALEPNDYLYFPSGGAGDISVLGEVRAPGLLPYDGSANVLAAIAARGGFTERAWKKRVLVVRGSRDHPQAFRVDVHDALVGGAPNLALEPGDLVYVANRPWVRAEELLEAAGAAFLESAVVTWTGLHIGPGGGATTIATP